MPLNSSQANHLLLHMKCFFKSRAAVERMWHIQDSQGQILALPFRFKSVKPFKVFPLRSKAERGVKGGGHDDGPCLQKEPVSHTLCLLLSLSPTHTHSLSLTHTLSLSRTLSLTHTPCLSLSLSHSRTLSLTLSLSHTRRTLFAEGACCRADRPVPARLHVPDLRGWSLGFGIWGLGFGG